MKTFNFSDFDGVEFDAHIQASIPNYDGLFEITKTIVEKFQQENSIVVDIGCSTGKLLVHLDEMPNVEYIGIDIIDMVPLEHKKHHIKYIHDDLIDTLTNIKESGKKVSVITSLFCLQFLKSHKRKQAISLIKDILSDGGIFICAEKIFFDSGKTQEFMGNLLLERKRKSIIP